MEYFRAINCISAKTVLVKSNVYDDVDDFLDDV